MSDGALEAIGGLGLFLVGMFVMTDGLKLLAGRALRAALRRFTRSPTSGAATGAVGTAVIQSSSATTVMAVGFVGAGLLTFPEALGIIFGANIGTTITGWLVALFGFKVPLGALAFPIVFVGAMGRTFLRGRWAAAAQAIAGFGLIFIGIEFLQEGMAGLEGTITPDSFPPNTWFGRLQLVGIGVLITLVTQSSSAGVAIAITSVYAGTITFPQAAAVVIGMDIGTTVTAAMAAIGGGTQVKRTGLAHVIYNVLTGIGAFALLVPYVKFMEWIEPTWVEDQPELLLVGFHTLFNGLGVLLVLPVASQFASLVERLVPTPDDQPTHALGSSLLADPDAALDVVEQTLKQLTQNALGLLLEMWRDPKPHVRIEGEITALSGAVFETREFVSRIERTDRVAERRVRHEATWHVLDHLDRLLARLRHRDRLITAATDPELLELGRSVASVATGLSQWIDGAGPSITEAAELAVDELVAEVRPFRGRVISRATGTVADQALVEAKIDAIRWLARTAVHLWRISLYLEHLAHPEASITAAEEEVDV